MGLPAIVWNGRTLSMPEDVTIMPWNPSGVGMMAESLSGERAVIALRTDIGVLAMWDMVVSSGAVDLDSKRKLRQFAQWCASGGTFTFARDSAETVSTTLASSASAGATSVVVTSATGITVGKEYVIRDKQRAIVVKCSNVSGTTISLNSEALDFGFASGARFRSAEYWLARATPGIEIVKDLAPNDPMNYSATLAFVEDVNDL